MFIVSPAIETKLSSKHALSKEEVNECLANMEEPDKFLIDDREEHHTNPPTHWFISETNHGRKLKVIFVPVKNNGALELHLKTAYDANQKYKDIYKNA